jgi:5-formyltetrahydrofolate cyclo-ligase
VSDKERLRVAAIGRRAARSEPERAVAAVALARHGVSAWAATIRCLAAYVGVGTEPPTLPLLDALRDAGVRVLLPVIVGERRLDWARYDGAGSLADGPLGLAEPAGPRLGAAALHDADLVVVPALAVDRAGHRLGRGRGDYDPALERIVVPVVAVVYDDDILDDVPVEPHDRSVQALLTPSGYFDV